MKKFLFLAAIACLVACTSPTDKVADTYFKAVVSQEITNADKSLVEVIPFSADSIRGLIINDFNEEIARQQKGLEAVESDEEYFATLYPEGLEQHEQECRDQIEKLQQLAKAVETMEFPQYYICKYNGSQFMQVTTEDATNRDDFTGMIKFLYTLRENIKEGK